MGDQSNKTMRMLAVLRHNPIFDRRLQKGIYNMNDAKKVKRLSLEVAKRGLQILEERRLLTKYMKHVKQCEGVDFTDRFNENSDDVKFSPVEVNHLLAASKIAGYL